MIGAIASASAVARGTLYEALASVALPPISFARRGGAGDGGVDLIGTLPQLQSRRSSSSGSQSLTLLAQCKWQRGRVGAPVIAALAAAVVQRGAAAGVVFASSGFSRDAARAALASRTPLLLSHLSLVESDAAGADAAPAPASAAAAAAAAALSGASAGIPRGAVDAVATLESLSPNRAFLDLPEATGALAGRAAAESATAVASADGELPPPPPPPPPPRIYRVSVEGRDVRVLLVRAGGLL